jgi:hypothetical protein
MEKILAKRYAFCDFSDIAGFPHPVPTINEWGDYLPRFRGSKYDHPGEHLFNFHECMLEHGFVHEDVLIKLFKFSLEGNAREWCQSLPAVSIHSLKDFHVAFNSYYEKIYPADLLFSECCHEEEIVPVENLKSEEGSLQFPDLQGLSDLQLENTLHHDPECIESAAYVIGSAHLPDLQKKEIRSRYEGEGKDLKGPDQQPVLYVSPTNSEQPTFNIETSEGSQQQFVPQFDHQQGEVFHHVFHDPIADFLESTNNINVKIFFIDGSWSVHLFEPLFYMLWLSLLFESRSSTLPVNKFLTWLHWKHEFT